MYDVAGAFLKGKENAVEKTATVEYFTVGENAWKTAEAWPPKNTVERNFYLDGEADTETVGNGRSCGAGILAPKIPENIGLDEYIYDPDNPAAHIIDVAENELEVPEDYTKEECREDVLSYSTPILTKPLTITGDAEVKLYISCDCPDTDLVVRITDVNENGKSIKLADGLLGVKYRNGFEKPEYMEPGEVYEVRIRTTKISNTFAPGHRMRLTVTSSAKNFIFPNSNTVDGFDGKIRQKAVVKVHRGAKYASCVKVRIEEE